MPELDVFLCHASEDKDAVVLPLAEELSSRGIAVWLDRHELTLGDSLSEKIDEGLARARFGVVVLSHAFFAKRWPRRELDGLVTRETTSGAKVILPVWHGLTVDEVTRYSPTLAGRLAANTSHGIASAADQIETALDSAPPPGRADLRGAPPEASVIDRDKLRLRPDFAFQRAMGLVEEPSSLIDWKPSLQVTYTGGRILTVEDIVPLPPPRIAVADGAKHEMQLVRVRNANYYESYGTYGDIIAAQGEEKGSLRHAEEWPLILKPGDRCRVVLHHEYELRLDGEPLTLRSNELLLSLLGPYLDLDRADDGGFQIGTRRLPTRIVSDEGEWEMDVAYGTFVAGVQIEMPPIPDRLLKDAPPRRRRRWLPWRR